MNSAMRVLRNKNTRYLIRLAVCIGLLAHVFYRYDATTILLRLKDIQFHWFAVAVLLMYSGSLVSSVKWNSILASYGHRRSLVHLWVLYIQAGFFNLLFPGFVAGDASRVALTSPAKKISAEAFTAVFLERLSGMVVALVFVTVAGLLGAYALFDVSFGGVIFALLVLCAAVLLVGLNMHRVPKMLRFVPSPVRPRVQDMFLKLHCAIASVSGRPALLARLALLSLVFVLLSGFVGYFIASSVSVPIPLYILLIYTPLIAMISGLPISIGGIGVRENLAVFFYAGLGFLPEDVVAYALTLTVLVFLVNLSGGAIMLFRVVRPVPGPVDRARSIS